jgi:hypothetical protein
MTAANTATTVVLRIEGTDPPAASCPGPDGVAIGIQRGPTVIDAMPSSTPDPRFHAELEIVTDGEATDFRGAYVHGPRGDRFLYLAWVGIRDGNMVARIKLKLADIDPGLLETAASSGGPLIARLRLVNPQGRPVSGSVRPPNVEWVLGEA